MDEILRLIATIGSPLALGTAFLFYFGWVRAGAQARALGFDSSIMNLSTTDYILKSINALYIPLVLSLMLAVVLNGLHERLIVADGTGFRHSAMLLRLGRLLGWSWILWVLLGILLLASAPLRSFSIPFSITIALLCVLYGRALLKLVARVEPWSSARKALVLALLIFVIFWDIERVARTFGEGYAALIVAEPQRLAAVTIYSAKSLEINAPGIMEQKLDGNNSEYHYRYKGLRLLQQSDGRYFLINERWDPQNGRVFVLRETNSLRMEFAF
jgi:hypothetical protein